MGAATLPRRTSPVILYPLADGQPVSGETTGPGPGSDVVSGSIVDPGSVVVPGS